MKRYHRANSPSDAIKNIIEETEYFPKHLRQIIHGLFALSGVLIGIGFLGFFASIFLAGIRDTQPDEKMIISFWGISVLGIFGFIVTSVLTGILSHKYRSRPRKRKQRGLSFSQIQEIREPKLRQSLISAVKKLNINDVDIGLFSLGRILESELKKLLAIIEEIEKYPIAAKDKSNLFAMIKWLERNNIPVTVDAEALHFLRKQRNRFAHGEPLDYKARKQLLARAPYLADLFLDSIVAIYKYRLRLILQYDLDNEI